MSLTQEVENFIKNIEAVTDAEFRKMVGEIMRLLHNHVADTPIGSPAQEPAPVADTSTASTVDETETSPATAPETENDETDTSAPVASTTGTV